ncbi:MarR family winged helix-turn-helix transcriptional regulator [Leifsonia poae]|uniref:MarR family winged helix-turn-helix transcriptional regulator n=1 Tax=Leifsonia poae TaxID=110933 RepID=UPI003D6734E7
MDPDARREAVETIEQAIGRFIKTIRTNLHESAAAFAPDLQPSAYAVMNVVAVKHPVAPAVIIAVTGMDKSSVSRQLRILKDSGYVTSEPDSEDRRADLYSPTPEAGARFEAIRAANRVRFGEVFTGWDEDEVITFATLLDKFAGPAKER